MARTRGPTRKSSGPAQRGTQKTLAFTNNKVTKPSANLPGKPSKLKSDIIKSEDIKFEFESASQDLGHIDSAPAIERQAKKEIQEVKQGLKEGKRSAAEVKASKVTDQQIRRFWREREDERLAPRVHMEGIRLEEKVCRYFDMSSEFGPCIGIPRIRRWTRAQKLGLNPPIEVLAVLLKEEEKGNGLKTERAHIDELLNSWSGVSSEAQSG